MLSPVALCGIALLYSSGMKQQLFPGITVDQTRRFGKPVIERTRVPVDLVVGKIAGGMTVDAIMEEYNLTRAQVLTALRYAATIVASEDVLVA